MRKKQRLSSPTYDDQVGDLTQEDLDAFDEIEARLSQKSDLDTHKWQRSIKTPLISSKFEGKINWNDVNTVEPSSSNPSLIHVNEGNNSDLQDDPDNPFTGGSKSNAAVIAPLPFRPPIIGFTSAAKLPIRDDYRSPSPEEAPPGPDIDAWFNPAPIEALPMFTTAKSITIPELVGFTKASTNSVIKPSSKALAKAKALLKVWESENMDPSSATDNLPLGTSFSRASIAGSPLVISSPSHPRPPKAFRSPLLKNTHTSNGVMHGSPLNPKRPISSSTFTSAASQLPHALSVSVNASPGLAITPQAGFTSSSSLLTPFRSNIRPTGVLRTRPAPFVTPFKPGMRPGEPGRSKLGQSPVVTTPPLAVVKKEAPQIWPTKDTTAYILKRKELGWFTALFPSRLCR